MLYYWRLFGVVVIISCGIRYRMSHRDTIEISLIENEKLRALISIYKARKNVSTTITQFIRKSTLIKWKALSPRKKNQNEFIGYGRYRFGAICGKWKLFSNLSASNWVLNVMWINPINLYLICFQSSGVVCCSNIPTILIRWWFVEPEYPRRTPEWKWC